MQPRAILGLREIAADYELFVVDQWGVLHDGVAAHPGAVDALQQLKAVGAAVALLSNSGKRVEESYHRLAKLGIDRSLYDLAITSGEQVYEGLMHRIDAFYEKLGPRFLMFAWDDDRRIVEGTGFEEVTEVAEAEFILCAGTDRPALTDYVPLLKGALERDLPMICANPDRVSVQPDGSLKICPGTIAEMYERMGGAVQWHGKPQRAAYEAIRTATGATGRGLGIGDSLAHDIAGAAGAQMDGLFVTNGIHRQDLNGSATPDNVATLGAEYGAVPEFFVDRLVW